MEYVVELFYSVLSVLSTINPSDILDILLLTIIIYKTIDVVFQTRAGQLVKGIGILGAMYLFCYIFKLKSLEFILEFVLSNGFIAVLIMFQPELRAALEKVGHTDFKKFFQDPEKTINIWTRCIDDICDSCGTFSKQHIGALIVIERKTALGNLMANGTRLNAYTSYEIFGNIFYPKAPLHDGAVIIRDGKIHSAGCMLPMPAWQDHISKALGSRHRAAIGMSENSDAIIVVVSEETGAISVAVDGNLHRNYTPTTLNKFLNDNITSHLRGQK